MNNPTEALLALAAHQGDLSPAVEALVAASGVASTRLRWAENTHNIPLLLERLEVEATREVLEQLATRLGKRSLDTLVRRGFSSTALDLAAQVTWAPGELRELLEKVYAREGRGAKRMFASHGSDGRLKAFARDEAASLFLIEHFAGDLLGRAAILVRTDATQEAYAKRLRRLDPQAASTVATLVTAMRIIPGGAFKPSLTRLSKRLPQSVSHHKIEGDLAAAASFWLDPTQEVEKDDLLKYIITAWVSSSSALSSDIWLRTSEDEMMENLRSGKWAWDTEVGDWLDAHKSIRPENAVVIYDHFAAAVRPGKLRATSMNALALGSLVQAADMEELLTLRPELGLNYGDFLLKQVPLGTGLEDWMQHVAAKALLGSGRGTGEVLEKILEASCGDMSAFDALAGNFTGTFKELLEVLEAFRGDDSVI